MISYNFCLIHGFLQFLPMFSSGGLPSRLLDSCYEVSELLLERDHDWVRSRFFTREITRESGARSHHGRHLGRLAGPVTMATTSRGWSS